MVAAFEPSDFQFWLALLAVFHGGYRLICCISRTANRTLMRGWRADMKQSSDKFNKFLHPKIKIRLKAEWMIVFCVMVAMSLYPSFQEFNGEICLYPSGFAADDAGTVYIGKDGEILCVYPDGTTRELRIPHYRGSYGMTVEGNVILIGRSYGLDGYQLNLSDGSVEPVMFESPMEVGSWLYTTESGDVYRMKNWSLRYRIERQLPDGTWQTVYIMEEREFYMKLVLLFSNVIGLSVLLLLMLCSAWTQGYFDGKTHGKPWKILVKVTLPPEGGQKDGT